MSRHFRSENGQSSSVPLFSALMRSFAGVTAIAAALTIGCGPASVVDQRPTPPPVIPAPDMPGDASIAPPTASGEHVRTGGGTAVDVNPPGGGIHVDVPPSPNGQGVHVDVGPGGVNVQAPN